MDEIITTGDQATAITADVTSSVDCDRIVQACLDSYGKIDFAIAAAGILRDRMVFNMTDAEFAAVVDVHLKGTFNVGRAAARAMRPEHRGAIITVSSTSHEGNWGQSNYAAAKGGIASMTYTWTMEPGRYGINVNSVAPTAWTRLIATFPGAEPPPPEIEPGSAMGSPENVAPIFAYLCSDKVKGITGQVFGLGGGLALWQHPRERIVAVQHGGFTLEDIRRTVNSLFRGQLELYGMAETAYK